MGTGMVERILQRENLLDLFLEAEMLAPVIRYQRAE
jgi:hypothetical protein